MNIHDKFWLISDNNSKNIKELIEGLNINRVTANVLINRGINNIDEAKKCLNSNLDNLNAFSIVKRLDNNAQELYIDMILDSRDVSFTIMDELEKLRPFGIHNPKPLFAYKNLIIESLDYIGKEKEHLKMIVQDGNRMFDCIYLNFKDNNNKLRRGQRVDLAFTLERSNFKGIETIIFDLKDIRVLDSFFYESKENMKLYYKSFNKVIEDLNNEYIEYNIDNPKIIDKRNTKKRLDFVINGIQNNKPSLILVNNPDSFLQILFELSDRNKLELLRNIDFSVPKHDISIVINPIPNLIDLSQYKTIFLYDIPLSIERLYWLCSESNSIYLLYNELDIKRTEKFLEYVIPNREDLAKLYKYLSKSIGINTYMENELCKCLDNMNISKLYFCLDILKKANLISVNNKEKVLVIDLLPPPDKKINIASTELYKRISGIKSSFKNFKIDAFKDIVQLFEEGF